MNQVPFQAKSWIFVIKTNATKIKLHNGVEKRCEFMESRFLLGIEVIGVCYELKFGSYQ